MSSSPSHQVPFFRLLIPFVLGILAVTLFGKFLNTDAQYFILLALFSLSLATILFRINWHKRWITGIIFYLFLFVAGVSITSNLSGESKIKAGLEIDALIRLMEPPDERLSSVRVLAKIEGIMDEGVWLPMDEKVMLYFRSADSAATNLKYGSRLAVRTTFTEPPDAQNPYQFNYKEYLAKKQLHRVAFISEGKWIEIGEKSAGLFSIAFKLRERLMSTYTKGGINDQNLAVVSALTMGYKGLLDDEIRRVYSSSGAMHILAVSGLHVGILFLIVSGTLFFLDRVRNGKKLKAIILILFLWFFAVFTGLSPSVMRASLMFSLVIAGIALNRRTSIYNTLSGSAFVLLCINPMLISDIGFQLSYLAVISIVFFYPYIYKLVFIKNKWLDKIWSLIAVSTAAQIGTVAIGLYYFQQFPNYFLLTNLFAIPLATIILYLAVGLIILSPIPRVTELIGWLLDKTLSLLNYLVSYTESLPYSTTTGIGISTGQTIILILAIILLAFFLEKRRASFLAGILGCLLLFFGENFMISHNRIHQSEMVVFNTRGSSTIGFTEGRSIVFATTDSTDQKPWDKHSFNLQGYINSTGVKVNPKVIKLGFDQEKFTVSDKLVGFTNEYGTWFDFGGKSIYVPTGDRLETVTSHELLDIDVLILANLSRPKIDELLGIFNPRVVVIDSTIPSWQAEKIKIQLEAKGIWTHSIDKNGAFRLQV